MPTAVEQLQTRKTALLAEIATGESKPSYSINGQTVDWPAYRRWLFDELRLVNQSLQMEQPFEIRTVAM